MGCYICRLSCETTWLVIAVARLVCTQAAVLPFHRSQSECRNLLLWRTVRNAVCAVALSLKSLHVLQECAGKACCQMASTNQCHRIHQRCVAEAPGMTCNINTELQNVYIAQSCSHFCSPLTEQLQTLRMLISSLSWDFLSRLGNLKVPTLCWNIRAISCAQYACTHTEGKTDFSCSGILIRINIVDGGPDEVLEYLLKRLCPKKAVALIPNIRNTQSTIAPLQTSRVSVCRALFAIQWGQKFYLCWRAEFEMLQPNCCSTLVLRPCMSSCWQHHRLVMEAVAAQVVAVVRSSTWAVLI